MRPYQLVLIWSGAGIAMFVIAMTSALRLPEAQAKEPIATLTVPKADYDALQRHANELEDTLRTTPQCRRFWTNGPKDDA